MDKEKNFKEEESKKDKEKEEMVNTTVIAITLGIVTIALVLLTAGIIYNPFLKPSLTISGNDTINVHCSYNWQQSINFNISISNPTQQILNNLTVRADYNNQAPISISSHNNQNINLQNNNLLMIPQIYVGQEVDFEFTLNLINCFTGIYPYNFTLFQGNQEIGQVSKEINVSY